MKYLSCLLLFVLTAFSTPAATSSAAIQHVQAVSVTVIAGRSAGSGTLITRTNPAGKEFTLCLTAGHVIEGSVGAGAHSVTNHAAVIPPIPFPLASPSSSAAVQVMTTITEGDRIVGCTLIDAVVVAFSPADQDDIAILLLRKIVRHPDVRFGTDKAPSIGTPLMHVGSMMGPFGAGSFTTGVLSQTGRVMFDVEFDQTSCTALPGSSGGGVFDESGTYVGMLVRGSAATVNFTVPVRRLRAWAKSQGIPWLFP